MKRSSFPLLCCLLVSCLFPAFGLDWATSFEEAKSRAAAEGKLVLTLFYGSEFTRRHAPLRQELLDGEAFRAYARDKFVPVEMYEPNDRAAHADFIWQYRALCLEYGIRTWPTTLVLTPEGIPTGGLTGGKNVETVLHAQVYRAHSQEERLNLIFTALDHAVFLAEKLQELEAMPDGEDRLRVLAATYHRFPHNLPARLVLARYLATMDPENKTELKEEFLSLREMVDWGEIGRYGMDSATALRKMQEMIDKARPANRLEMLRQRYHFQSHHLDAPDDMRAFQRAMETYAAEWEKTDPAGAAALRREHEELYGGEPNEAFRRLQERREAQRREEEERRQQKKSPSWRVRRSLWH